MKIGILGSGRGTHLNTLAQAVQQKKINGHIAMVISNKENAMILANAKAFDLPYQFVNPINVSRDVFDQNISHLFKQAEVDLIILMGYMRILSPAFVKAWEGKMINIHPSLLPLYAGIMDLAVHESVLQAGDKKTGCTIHYVTEQVDAGPIILQKECLVLINDTVQTLKSRVQNLEAEALLEAMTKLDSGTF